MSSAPWQVGRYQFLQLWPDLTLRLQVVQPLKPDHLLRQAAHFKVPRLYTDALEILWVTHRSTSPLQLCRSLLSPVNRFSLKWPGHNRSPLCVPKQLRIPFGAQNLNGCFYFYFEICCLVHNRSRDKTQVLCKGQKIKTTWKVSVGHLSKQEQKYLFPTLIVTFQLKPF